VSLMRLRNLFRNRLGVEFTTSRFDLPGGRVNFTLNAIANFHHDASRFIWSRLSVDFTIVRRFLLQLSSAAIEG